MQNFFLNQFERFISLRLPNLFSHYNRRKEVYSISRVMAEYVLAPKIKIEELKADLDEIEIMCCLYYYRPTNALAIGQKICYYSLPLYNFLFKVDSVSNIDGLCDSLQVTIFDSIELMRYHVLTDFEKQSKTPGLFYGKNFKDVQLDFL